MIYGQSQTYMPMNMQSAIGLSRGASSGYWGPGMDVSQWRPPQNSVSGSLGGSGFGGFGGAGGNMTLSQMLAMQRSENAQNKQQNIATRQATLNELGGVPTAFEGDPLWQATRQSAMNLVQNPEAINDQTQQKIINRQANLVNAGANTDRDRARAQMASMGLLGGSAESQALGGIERQRTAGLADAATTLEIERAQRRNQDILASQQMGAALAGQQSGVRQNMAGIRANTDLYFQPENLSGYAGYFAQQGGGGAGPAINNSTGLTHNELYTGGGMMGATGWPVGQQSPGQTGFAPGLNGAYSWTGQMSGGSNGGYVPTQYNPNQYDNFSSDYWNSLSAQPAPAYGLPQPTPYNPGFGMDSYGGLR